MWPLGGELAGVAVVVVVRVFAGLLASERPTGLTGSAGRGESTWVDVAGVSESLRSWMSAVSEIVRAVNAAEPLEAVLTQVAAQARVLIGFEYCAVMLADTGGECLRVVGWCGLSSDYVALLSGDGSLRIHPSGVVLDTPAARAYREQTTVAVADVRGASEYGRLQALAPAQGYLGLVAAPLPSSGKGAGPAGVLVGYAITAREFTGSEIELLELLAGQAALALETAQLRSDQRTVIEQLSEANDELRRGRERLDWAERCHRELMRLVLDEVGLAGLVAALATMLAASVTVEDADERVLARAPSGDYQPPPDAAARRRPSAREALELMARSYDAVPVPVVSAGGLTVRGAPVRPSEETAWVAPVVLGQELVGRLWVTSPRAVPAPVQLRVIERFALVVSLELLKARHLVDVETRLSGDLLADLLRPDGPAQAHAVLERAAALGVDLNRPHTIAVLGIDGPVRRGARVPERIQAVAEAGERVLVGSYENDYVLLVPIRSDAVELLRRVYQHLDRLLGPQCTVTLVAGPTAAAPEECATAYRVTRGAGRLRRASHPGGLVDIRTFGMSTLLLDTGAPDSLRRFAERLLGPVAVYDERRGGELVRTLRVWLSTGCSTSTAAKALVVHPNTIGYRLGRIEELTGRSLRGFDARVEFQIALTVLDIAGLDAST